MAATVVAVVVFLCGLLVGRGVPLGEAMTGRGLAGSAGSSPFVLQGRPAVTSRPSREPSAAALAGDDLTYNQRLDGTPPADTFEPLDTRDSNARLGEAAPMPVPDEDDVNNLGYSARVDPEPPAPTRRPVGSEPAFARSTPTSVSPAESPTTASTRMSDAKKGGFTIQVIALRERAAAERVAEGLMAKGYPAFVADPIDDAPVTVFRVRVGRYADRTEAERIRQRLEREEQLNPWITH